MMEKMKEKVIFSAQNFSDSNLEGSQTELSFGGCVFSPFLKDFKGLNL